MSEFESVEQAWEEYGTQLILGLSDETQSFMKLAFHVGAAVGAQLVQQAINNAAIEFMTETRDAIVAAKSGIE